MAEILSAEKLASLRKSDPWDRCGQPYGCSEAGQFEAICESHEALRAEVQRLRAALKAFGWHGGGCESGAAWRDGDEQSCTCGLASALAHPQEPQP